MDLGFSNWWINWGGKCELGLRVDGTRKEKCKAMLHGREAEEERKKDRIRHMWTAPTRVNNNSVVAAPDFVPSPPSSSLSSADSFYKVLLFFWDFFLCFFGSLFRLWEVLDCNSSYFCVIWIWMMGNGAITDLIDKRWRGYLFDIGIKGAGSDFLWFLLAWEFYNSVSIVFVIAILSWIFGNMTTN